MSFQGYMRILWRRRWDVIVVVLVLVAVSLLYSLASTKQYDASADLLLSPQLPSALLQANDPAAAQTTVDVPTAIEVITSGDIAELVRKDVGVVPPVTVSEVGATSVVKITVQSPDPELASRAANAYADAYLEDQREQVTSSLQQATQLLDQRLTALEQALSTVSGEINSGSGSGAQAGAETELATTQQALEVEESTLENEVANYQTFLDNEAYSSGQLISPATTPSSPDKPKIAEYAVLAALAGLVLGIGWALFLEVLNPQTGSRGPGMSDSQPLPAGGGAQGGDLAHADGQSRQPLVAPGTSGAST